MYVPRIAFTLDDWSSSYGNAFLGVTAHYLDEKWQLQDLTLGFEHLTGKHTGLALMQAFVRVIERFQLERKIISITTDSGSNVRRMGKELEAYTEAHSNKW